jgi:hypothetical protein
MKIIYNRYKISYSDTISVNFFIYTFFYYFKVLSFQI